MKSFIYVTLLLITLTFCDDCSSKTKDQCTGTCKWTDGKAATCTKKTDCAAPTVDSTTSAKSCADATNCKLDSNSETCVSVATSCALKNDGTDCDSAAGCVYTAATEGKCSASSSGSGSSSGSDSDSSKSSAFGLKTSFLLSFLSFFF